MCAHFPPPPKKKVRTRGTGTGSHWSFSINSAPQGYQGLGEKVQAGDREQLAAISSGC